MRPKLRLYPISINVHLLTELVPKAECPISQARVAADPMVSSHISNQFKQGKKKNPNQI